jgi:hypothetical protein
MLNFGSGGGGWLLLRVNKWTKFTMLVPDFTEEEKATLAYLGTGATEENNHNHR